MASATSYAVPSTSGGNGSHGNGISLCLHRSDKKRAIQKLNNEPSSNTNFLYHFKHLSQLRTRSIKNSIKLPQHLTLYIALFLSIIALIFSIRTQFSSDFVKLEEPIRVGLFVKDVDHVGISTWELCVIYQSDVEDYVSNSKYEEDNQPAGLSGPAGFGSFGLEDAPSLLRFSATRDVHDSHSQERGSSTLIRTVYHTHAKKSYTGMNDSSPGNNKLDEISRSRRWTDEPEHDDFILVTPEFPHNDDDTFEDVFSPYWDCHRVRISSKQVYDDEFWVMSRVFHVIGTLLGAISIGLLVALMIIRIKCINNGENSRKIKNYLQQHKNSSVDLETFAVLDGFPSPDELSWLETNDSGYRPVSACFFASYLLQSLAFLFLDSEICRNQTCSLSSSAHHLLIACALWIVSGLLVLRMTRVVRENDLKIRRFKKKREKALLVLRSTVHTIDSFRTKSIVDIDEELADKSEQFPEIVQHLLPKE